MIYQSGLLEALPDGMAAPRCFGVVELPGNFAWLWLAIIDDLGAILVIALFYVGDFSLSYFLLSMGVFAGLLIFNRLGVRGLVYYLIPGIFMWYFMLQSGVHATLAGVLLAFAIPFGDGGEKSPSYILQHALHKPVAFLIVPLFALANTGIVLVDGWVNGRAVLEDVNRSMKLIRYSNRGYFLEVEEIAERERPPMIEVPEYQEHIQTLVKK